MRLLQVAEEVWFAWRSSASAASSSSFISSFAGAAAAATTENMALPDKLEILEDLLFWNLAWTDGQGDAARISGRIDRRKSSAHLLSAMAVASAPSGNRSFSGSFLVCNRSAGARE